MLPLPCKHAMIPVWTNFCLLHQGCRTDQHEQNNQCCPAFVPRRPSDGRASTSVSYADDSERTWPRALSSGESLPPPGVAVSGSEGLPRVGPPPSRPPPAAPSLPLPSPPWGVAAAMLSVGRLPSKFPRELPLRGPDHAVSLVRIRPRDAATCSRAEAEAAATGGSRPSRPFLPR